jgi:hypothetical protein
VDTARAGGYETDAEFARPFGIAACVEGRCFFVANLDETNLVASRSQRLDNAVDAIAGQPENRIDVPFYQRFDKEYRRR